MTNRILVLSLLSVRLWVVETEVLKLKYVWFGFNNNLSYLFFKISSTG